MRWQQRYADKLALPSDLVDVLRWYVRDLCRASEIKDVLTRPISGHATEAMQRHYSTVSGDEQRVALAKVIELARIRVAS